MVGIIISKQDGAGFESIGCGLGSTCVRFPPQSRDIPVRLNGDCKLAISVNS